MNASDYLKPGTRVGDDGRYVIQSTIAIGGMAVVYHGRDTRLGNDCAVKALVLPDNEDVDQRLAMFHYEAKILARLSHPGVVGVRDFFEEGTHAFLIMDFVPGRNLYDEFKRNPTLGEDTGELRIEALPDAQVIEFGRMLAETINSLHRHDPPIIYRDLKPHNIMLNPEDGRLILLDFGIARFFRTHRAGHDDEPLGTPGYAAPEQYIAGAHIDERTDIYSLGAVLHELATGFNPRGVDEYMPPPRPQTVRPYISPGLARILERCLEQEPARRYQSVVALLDDLARWRPTPHRGPARAPAASDPVWDMNLGAPVTSQLLGVRNAVFYADNGGMVAAINTGTGDPIWLYREPGDHTSRILVRSSLSITEEDRHFAYSFPTADGRQGISVLDAETGAAVWRSHEPIGKQATPLLTATGTLIVAGTEPDILMSVPITSQSAPWKRVLKSGILTLTYSPPHYNRPEYAIATDREGFTRAYDTTTGKTIWRTRIGHGPIVAPPVLAADILFVGGGRGDTSYAGLNVLSGEILWRVPLAAEVIGPAAVVADQTLVVVPTRNAGLIGLDARTGEKRWHDVTYTRPLTGAAKISGAPSVALTEYGGGGRVLIVNVAASPVLAWQIELSPAGSVAPPFVSGEFLVAASTDGTVTAWALT